MGKLWDIVKEAFNPQGMVDTWKNTKKELEWTISGENQAYNEAHEQGKTTLGAIEKSMEAIKNGVMEKLGMESEEQQQIQDTTQSGIESAINGTDIKQFMEEQQAKQWEREDKIRAEVEAREDSAMQRAVRDAQLAGINPNLMNMQPAASGGGITSATGLEYQTYQAEMKEYLTLLEQEIENEFKGDENKKDRWNQLISSLIMAMIMKR